MCADRITGSMQIDFPQPVLSPCIGICQLDDEGLCVGCFRSGDEIGQWPGMSHPEREHMMNVVLPQREAEQE
jgi:uncharacterized protein